MTECTLKVERIESNLKWKISTRYIDSKSVGNNHAVREHSLVDIVCLLLVVCLVVEDELGDYIDGIVIDETVESSRLPTKAISYSYDSNDVPDSA